LECAETKQEYSSSPPLLPLPYSIREGKDNSRLMGGKEKSKEKLLKVYNLKINKTF
jgi:hypothetical protein